MARKEQTAVRIDDDTRERLYALLPMLSTVGHEATLSDALRAAAITGLPLLERANKFKPVSLADPMKKGAGK